MTDSYKCADRPASTRSLRKWLWSIGIVAVITYCGIVGFYAYFFWYTLNRTLSDDTQVWGVFGDFVGGVTNPILTFISMIGILMAVYFQRRDLDKTQEELALTREQLQRAATAQADQSNTMRRQAFERTFFEMIRMQSDIAGEVDWELEDSEPVAGRRACKYIYEHFKQTFEKSRLTQSYSFSLITESYEQFYAYNKFRYGHAMRLAGRILMFVYQHDDTEEVKRNYYRLIRAHLSEYEILLLFYHALCERFSYLKPAIEEARLFRGVEERNLVDHKFDRQLYDELSFSD